MNNKDKNELRGASTEVLSSRQGRAKISFGQYVLMCFLVWPAAATLATAADERVATMVVGLTSVYWQPMMPDYRLVMTISGPGGFTQKTTYEPGQMPGLDMYNNDGSVLEDGGYRYQLQAMLELDPVADQELADARQQEDEQMITILHQLGRVPEEAAIQTGTIQVRNGAFVVGD